MNLDERLRLSNCLDDYKLQEVVVVAISQPQHHKISASHSVQDVPVMSGTGPAAAATSGNNNMPVTGKTALKTTTSESAMHHHHAGHDKKKRGLFGLFHFGKNKKGSVRACPFFLYLFLWTLFPSRHDYMVHLI